MIANLVGSLKRQNGFDIHGRQKFDDPIPCPFSPVNLALESDKTSVRSDSSGSRGSADRSAVEEGQILLPKTVSVKNGDVFSFGGVSYKVMSVHPRYSVCGQLDHHDCKLELFQE